MLGRCDLRKPRLCGARDGPLAPGLLGCDPKDYDLRGGVGNHLRVDFWLDTSHVPGVWDLFAHFRGHVFRLLRFPLSRHGQKVVLPAAVFDLTISRHVLCNRVLGNVPRDTTLLGRAPYSRPLLVAAPFDAV